jgi:hypothetical protein
MDGIRGARFIVELPIDTTPTSDEHSHE